jgi:hypothetical protein
MTTVTIVPTDTHHERTLAATMVAIGRALLVKERCAQTVQPSTVGSRAARIAFWVLVALTGVLGAIHLAGTLAIADGPDERLMFTCFTALNALSLIVLLVPLHAGQPWAWAASWIQVVPNALVMPILGWEGHGLQYLAFTVVMALCLLVTRPAPRS